METFTLTKTEPVENEISIPAASFWKHNDLKSYVKIINDDSVVMIRLFHVCKSVEYLLTWKNTPDYHEITAEEFYGAYMECLKIIDQRVADDTIAIPNPSFALIARF